MITLQELKEQQKVLAKKIRGLKGKRKEARNGYVSGLNSARAEYRYQHIAYCIARGRTYDQIEPKSRLTPSERMHLEYMYKRILSNIEIPVRGAEDAEVVCSS